MDKIPLATTDPPAPDNIVPATTNTPQVESGFDKAVPFSALVELYERVFKEQGSNKKKKLLQVFFFSLQG